MNQDSRSFLKIEKLLSGFQNKHGKTLVRIEARWEKLQQVCRRIERSWSGSFVGWHGNMYYRDFEIPQFSERFSGEWGGIRGVPNGWQEKQPEEVQAKINELVGGRFSVVDFEKKVQKVRAEARELRDEIKVVFCGINLQETTEKEKGLFERIENFDFGKEKDELIMQRMPHTVMSRDLEALRQGTCFATWLYYEAVAIEGGNVCSSIATFVGMVDRFIRQLSSKPNSEVGHRAIDNDKLSQLHLEIYKKCHKLYVNETYPEAVEKGFKVVRDRLRKLTGYETGADAFGRGKLYIKGAAAPNVDKDFNKAVKFLTMSIDNFRNVKSHTSDAKIDDPIRAYEYLCLSSLAMRLLDNAEISDRSSQNQA